tara:strand:+ start:226 stop:387 length:162 start_codon:yes stop_codon:yes gene_type:complete
MTTAMIIILSIWLLSLVGVVIIIQNIFSECEDNLEELEKWRKEFRNKYSDGQD